MRAQKTSVTPGAYGTSNGHPSRRPRRLARGQDGEEHPVSVGAVAATEAGADAALVGLNAFEPGQAHALHAHEGMDKVYQVVEGEGRFLLDDRELPMRAGDLLVAPSGVPHGVRNTSPERLLVLVFLAPSPPSA